MSESVVTKTAWLIAAVILGALIVITAKRGELSELLHILWHTQLMWLLAGLALQILTYFTAAGVWHAALLRTPYRQPMPVLFWLTLAMLFSNQAVPTAGVSGGLVVVSALVGRGVPESIAMSALLLGWSPPTSRSSYRSALQPCGPARSVTCCLSF
jgi:uncharacterized membrane protein YbhN (UPF0104 family)